MTIENVENNCFLRFLLYICEIKSKNEKYGTSNEIPYRDTGV